MTATWLGYQGVTPSRQDLPQPCLGCQLAAEDLDYLESDDSVLAALISEIIRRDLDDLAEAVDGDPASAGREAT